MRKFCRWLFAKAREQGFVQFFRVMKLTAFILTFLLLQVQAREGAAQNITLSGRHLSLKEIFTSIEKQTGYVVFGKKDLLRNGNSFSMNVQNMPLRDFLTGILKDQSIDFEITGKSIALLKSKSNAPILIEVTPTPEVVLPPVKIKITDSLGNPLSGATVTLSNGRAVGSTNENGLIDLNLMAGDVFTVSFIGMRSETITLSTNALNNGELTVTLYPEVQSMDQVDLVLSTGYQRVPKERATGAFGSVNNDILSRRPVTSLANAISGQVAGMVEDPVAGFVIRGRSSLSGDRTPLLVVDGFPIEGGFNALNPNDVQSVTVLKDAAASSIYGARAANGVIVVVTKKAAASKRLDVQYDFFLTTGSRPDLDYYFNIADSKTQIDFMDKWWSTYKGTSMVSDPYAYNDFIDGQSAYAALLWEREKGNITQDYFDAERQKLLSTSYKGQYDKYLTRNYLLQQHNLSISGSSERNSYKLNALYSRDLTSFQNNVNDKLMLNFGNTYNISKGIKYTLSANLTSTAAKMNGANAAYLKSITQPWSQLVDENGNYARMETNYYEPYVQQFEPLMPYSYRYNALEENTLKNNKASGLDLRLQNIMEINLAKGLKFIPMFQYEYNTAEDISIYSEKMYATRNYVNSISALNTTTGKYESQIPLGGIYRKNSASKKTSYKVRGQFDYDTHIGDKHEFSAIAGGEVISTTTDVAFPELKFGYSASGLNYAQFNYKADMYNLFNSYVYENSYTYEGAAIYNFASTAFRQSYKYNDRYFAAYANGSYTFDKKYTASFSVRTDASNYVAKSLREKFSPFYSGGIRWNIANEKFMQPVEWVNSLALRGTYGVTGLAAGKGSVQSVTVYSSVSPTTETGNYPTGNVTGRDNDLLTWEKTSTINLGLDFSLFKRKLNGSIDMYRRYSKDVLSSVATSQVVQSTTSLSLNMGEILNKGIELTLGTNASLGKDFSWQGQLNADLNYNEVTRFAYQSPLLIYYLGGNNNGYVEGKPTDYLYMIKIVGTTKDGYFVQEKRNGELVVANNINNSLSFASQRPVFGTPISEDDRVWYMGRLTPPVTMGFTNTFNWKQFSLMAVITGKFGHVFRMYDQFMQYSFRSLNYSATGLASIQSPSTIATDNTGNVFPAIVNQSMLGESSSNRNNYSNVIVAPADNIRLNELYLSYAFPNSLFGSKGIPRHLSLFAQGRNLGIIWKKNKNGQDPDFPIGTMRPLKLFTFGAQIKF